MTIRPPPIIEPRGLSRSEAAAYIGVSATLFGELVAAGVFPAPKRIRSRCVWDRRSLDRAFDDLPEALNLGHDGQVDPWKDVAP